MASSDAHNREVFGLAQSAKVSRDASLRDQEDAEKQNAKSEDELLYTYRSHLRSRKNSKKDNV